VFFLSHALKLEKIKKERRKKKKKDDRKNAEKKYTSICSKFCSLSVHGKVFLKSLFYKQKQHVVLSDIQRLNS
jgi:hypothetical protein